MEARKTPLYSQHVAAGAKIVDFAGWQMPIQYPQGIVQEHLATRSGAGIFDVSHMGRFCFSGPRALDFLQYVLTNDASALQTGQSQYTILANENGGAIDDAYLYRFVEDEYILVVNASNKDKDWTHLSEQAGAFGEFEMSDQSDAIAMISLQGPDSEGILSKIMTSGDLPDPARNSLSIIEIDRNQIFLARTGYTGEPVCFELFVPSPASSDIWQSLLQAGAEPIGLGARDTLRLEAGLPLYGHEFGIDADGKEIPIYACMLASFAVSFSEQKGDFIGKRALEKQNNARKQFIDKDYSSITALSRRIRQVALLDKGIARDGSEVYHNGEKCGYITSGTMVPYRQIESEDPRKFSDKTGMRAVGLAMIDSKINAGEEITVKVRNRQLRAVIMKKNLENRKGTYSYAVLPE